MDNLYYIARSVLNIDDDTFWDSSPKFIFKQFDIHLEKHKDLGKGKKGNVRKEESNKSPKKKYKVFSESEVSEWQMKKV